MQGRKVLTSKGACVAASAGSSLTWFLRIIGSTESMHSLSSVLSRRVLKHGKKFVHPFVNLGRLKFRLEPIEGSCRT